MAARRDGDDQAKARWAASTDARVHRIAGTFGNLMVDLFHYLALFAIGATIVWAGVAAFLEMAAKGHPSIADILLLFIYLEMGAMVGIYFKTTHMPVRFLIYIGITALTRLLIHHVQDHHVPDPEIFYVCGGILILALATLVIRFGSARFPADSPAAERG